MLGARPDRSIKVLRARADVAVMAGHARPAPISRVIAAVVLSAVGVLGTTPAVAAGPLSASTRTLSVDNAGPRSSTDDLRDRVSAASAKVAQLRRTVDGALARYRDALRDVASTVNASVLDDRRAMSSDQLAAARADTQDERIRALYMSGGSLGVLGSVLQADSPSDLATRVMFAGQVLDLGQADALNAQRRADEFAVQAAVSERAANRSIATAQDVEAATRRLRSVLRSQRAELQRLRSAASRAAAREALAAAQRAAAVITSSVASTVTAGGVPVDYLRLYRRAAGQFCALPWVVLAAVGQVESGHGSSVGPSAAGAEGPMQFLPSTFAAYAVDGDGDGTASIWSPADSIATAARYLCANGAGAGPRGLYSALWRYNQADWYVQMVMQIAGQLAQRFGEPVPVATRPG